MDIYEVMANLWAKMDKNGGGGWHPLILHMLDVAASVDAILAREPESTRIRMAASLGMDWEDARAWLLRACHDSGKDCQGFQCMTGDPYGGFATPSIPDCTGYPPKWLTIEKT